MKCATKDDVPTMGPRAAQPSTPPCPAAARAPVRTWDTAVLKKEMLRQLGGDTEVYPNQLEQRFPHVLARITALWGSPEMDGYFASLLFSDRQGRQGFPPAVAMEISRLSTIHRALGLARSGTTGAWNIFTDGDAERWKKQRVRS